MIIFVIVKFIVSITIIFILIFQSGVNTFFFINYHRSVEKYEAHCVNKSKPEMKCHGKCKMMEETKRFGFLESEDDNQPNIPQLKSLKNLELFFENEMEIVWMVSVNQIKNYSEYSNPIFSMAINIPHPPPENI